MALSRIDLMSKWVGFCLLPKNTKGRASQLVFEPMIGSFGQKWHEWRDFEDEGEMEG
jgi:hypothetical protein